MTWLPSADAVTDIHYSLAEIFQKENDPISPAGVKSQQMLESACERPNTGIGNTFKYQTLEQKVAALFHSLTKNHPFHNGNKRTALVSMLTALHRNDRHLSTSITDDVIYDFVVAVTADEFPSKSHGLSVDAVVDSIARWIKKNSVSTTVRPKGMKTRAFIDKCLVAGAHCKNASGGAYVVSNGGSSIRISKSTKQLDGAVVRNYLNRLSLSETDAGISIEEFQDGVSGEREQIYRYMTALRRLAKT